MEDYKQIRNNRLQTDLHNNRHKYKQVEDYKQIRNNRLQTDLHNNRHKILAILFLDFLFRNHQEVSKYPLRAE